VNAHKQEGKGGTTRRGFLLGAAAAMIVPEPVRDESVNQCELQTVLGRVRGAGIGRMLPHEHVMVDFIGADKTGPHRWNRDEVFRVMKPHLDAARQAGVTCIAECTPMFLGRDILLLERLARATKLHILTNTGLYKAPYLPAYAFEADADRLAARWIAEWQNGIEGTSVKPGFIKIAVNPGKLEPVQRKIVQAAARTSRATGLTIACHTGHGKAALECLEILREESLPLDRFIFVHADAEPDQQTHLEVARAGAWVEYDSIGWRPLPEHVRLITSFLRNGPANCLLLSHDAGWYHVGEEGGGEIKPMTPLFKHLLPLLRREGMTDQLLLQLTRDNPICAFAIRKSLP